jgi:cation:H+ antiporter
MFNLSELLHGVPWLVLLLIFGGGLTGLTLGGEWLCRGAATLASLLKVKPVIIGLTVVSIATSMPELFTSLIGNLSGSPGLAIGNIVGSNISNIGLILGISALICPLVVRSRLIRIDVPILVVVTFIFTAMCWNSLSRLDGAILALLCGGYLIFIIREARQEQPGTALAEEVTAEFAPKSLSRSVVWVVLGTVALGLGAELLVRSSVEMAGRLGVSDVLVGLTIVAIGTSLPELAASIAAALRRHVDLCAGNIVGSNLFNLILISGVVSLVAPIEVEQRMFVVEFPVLIFFTCLMWPFFFTGKIVSRKEGVLLLILYAVFLILSVSSQSGWF